jgi:hypothetical protein
VSVANSMRDDRETGRGRSGRGPGKRRSANATAYVVSEPVRRIREALYLQDVIGVTAETTAKRCRG